MSQANKAKTHIRLCDTAVRTQTQQQEYVQPYGLPGGAGCATVFYLSCLKSVGPYNTSKDRGGRGRACTSS
jgi:hypothetical protein